MKLDDENDATYLMDAGLALSQRARWEHLFHAELTKSFAGHDDPTALTASILPSWLTTRAERSLMNLTSRLPSWTRSFIASKNFTDPDNVGAEAGAMPPVTATDIADALAPTLATAAFAQHVLTLLNARGITHKRWVTRHDDKVRASHREVDKQVVPLGSPFVVGGALMQYPADARTAPIGEWINDRCVIIGADGP